MRLAFAFSHGLLVVSGSVALGWEASFICCLIAVLRLMAVLIDSCVALGLGGFVVCLFVCLFVCLLLLLVVVVELLFVVRCLLFVIVVC